MQDCVKSQIPCRRWCEPAVLALGPHLWAKNELHRDVLVKTAMRIVPEKIC